MVHIHHNPIKIRIIINPGSGMWFPVQKHEAEHLDKHGKGTSTAIVQHVLDAHNWPHKEQHGGFLPILAPIAPHILPVLGGLGAAAGLAGGIPTAVYQGKQAAEVDRASNSGFE